jgi:hypothetical protein
MSLLRAWPALLLGWGPIVLALMTSAVGLLTEGAAWLLVSAVAAAVPSTMVANDPGRGWAIALPVVLVLAAWQVRRQRRGLAALLVLACVAGALTLLLGA